MAGAVRLPLARSCPCGLPSCSLVCVKSKMSSTTCGFEQQRGRQRRGREGRGTCRGCKTFEAEPQEMHGSKNCGPTSTTPSHAVPLLPAWMLYSQPSQQLACST